jgi:glycosyltransferase involved in cell wall biosynthesis
MKVLWFTDSPSLASAHLNIERNITGWIVSLQKEIEKNNEIQLGVAFPFGYEKESNFELNHTQYFSYPFPKTKSNLAGIWDRWNHKIESENIIAYYLKIVDKFKPDVIHVFGTESPFGLIIPQVKVPVVIHIQGNLTITAKKWFSGLSSINVLRYSNVKNLIKAYGLWHLYFHFSNRAARERKLMNYCRYYIGRTDWDRRISKVFSPSSTYFHCEELLRDEFYHVQPWQKPEKNKIRLVSTISTMAYKGLETILEASNLLKNICSSEIEWIVAGINGNEEIIRMIEKSTNLKFADHNICFKGSLSAEKLIIELREANMYVHPSHIENSPNSICEAMIMGMPVVATYAGGTPSILENGKEGLLVQDGDPYSLTGAITDLIMDKDLTLLISRNAYKRAVLRHDKQLVRERMSFIYQKIFEDSKQQLNQE